MKCSIIIKVLTWEDNEDDPLLWLGELPGVPQPSIIILVGIFSSAMVLNLLSSALLLIMRHFSGMPLTENTF